MEPSHHLDQETNSHASSLDSGTSSIDTAAKEKHQRLFERGVKWIGAGSVLMAISFGMNFFFFSDNTTFLVLMYTVPSLGGIFITIGLVDILGF